MHAMLGCEPFAGSVSWMIPICQALQEGGIQEAYARYAQIKDSPDYFFDTDELVTLVYQLMAVRKYDLASEVLGLNLMVFPEHAESQRLLASLSGG
mgnify:FL=1